MEKPAFTEENRGHWPCCDGKTPVYSRCDRKVFPGLASSLETPPWRTLSTLTEPSVSEEGDQLLFKVLNSSDFA